MTEQLRLKVTHISHPMHIFLAHEHRFSPPIHFEQKSNNLSNVIADERCIISNLCFFDILMYCCIMVYLLVYSYILYTLCVLSVLVSVSYHMNGTGSKQRITLVQLKSKILHRLYEIFGVFLRSVSVDSVTQVHHMISSASSLQNSFSFRFDDILRGE